MRAKYFAVCLALVLGAIAGWVLLRDQPAPYQPSSVDRPASADRPALPVPTRSVTAAEQQLLFGAEERLVGRCVADAGFTYRDQAPPTPPRPVDRVFAYVVDDVAWARTYGYGVTLTRRQPTAPDPNDEYVKTLSTADQREYGRKLLGEGRQIAVELPSGGRFSVSDHGCRADARRTLYGDLAYWFRVRKIVDNTDVLVRREVRADTRYAAAVRDWAACVSRTGHPVTDIGGLREELDRRTGDLPAARALPIERELAVIEATCANSSSLARTLRALEPQHQAAVAAQYRHDRQDLTALELAALPRARAALAEGN